MPARKAPPPVAAIAVGVLIAGAVAVVVLNRAANPARDRRAADAPPPPPSGPVAGDGPSTGLRSVPQLRHALDANPDDVEALTELRRGLPPYGKGEVAERLTRCARPEDHFDELLDDARVDGDEPGAAALFAGLKKARPNDPRWGCDEIEKMVRGKTFAAATERFGELLKAATTDETRSRFLVTFLHEMRTAGQGLDAYAAVPDAHAATALRMLGSRLENVILEGAMPKDAAKADLRALVAAHRKRLPDDPPLRYYEGVLLQGDGEFEKAERAYAEGMAKRPAPPRPKPGDFPKPGDWVWDYEMYRTRRVECLCKLGQAMRAYAEVGPAEDTFRQIAFALVKEKKPDALAELIAAHAKRFPEAPELPFWNGELLFLKGEYAKAAEAFAAFEKSSPNPTPERWRVAERLVLSHLRAGDADAARRVMGSHQPDRVPTPLRVAVLAKLGDVDGVATHVEFELGVSGRGVWFYSDEDFAREFAAAQFADLRAKYPDPRKK
ncbi:MAG TPA: hypothetical protein VMZ71_03520 [Gemmataceae bacterium]|nr:hypothetical protein [Gemmataceae bacterium]